MKPIQFTPILKRTRWGGRRLGTALGKPVGPENDYAESWEIVDHGEDQSIVNSGEFSGWTLKRLLTEHAQDLWGTKSSISQFPLLIKFLDANDRLSVQVHPDDQLARTFDIHENGKTEAWVILSAEPGSCVYSGLQPGISEQDLRTALQENSVDACLHRVTVEKGDCIFIPAGTVHAIAEGIVLAEVQQSSDMTFRLYDWGRMGTDGKPRELHIEESMQATDFQRGPVDPVAPHEYESDANCRSEELVSCEQFVIHRHFVTKTKTIAPENGCRIVLAVDGKGTWRSSEESSPHEFVMGQTLLIPASSSPVEFQSTDSLTLIETWVP